MSGTAGTAHLLLTITPNTEADQERLAAGLEKLMAEDPTLAVNTNAAGEVVVGAVGELHLEIVVDRLRREFNVEAFVGSPQVDYKETLTRRADGEMKYWKRAADRGHYGHVKIHVYPGEAESGYVFVNETVGAIPKEYINAIEEGIKESLTRGVVAGYPVEDVRIELYDGSTMRPTRRKWRSRSPARWRSRTLPGRLGRCSWSP